MSHYNTTFISLRPTSEIKAKAEKMAKDEFQADPDLYSMTIEVRAPRGHTREIFQFERHNFNLPMGANID